MDRVKKVAFMVIAMAAVVLVTGAPAQADQKNTGQDCANYYWFDGQGIQHAGYRCAQGRVNYSSYNAVLWKITSYDMRYDVSAGLSFGPHNNENPFKIDSGWKSGTQSWLSPDSGDANVGWFNRGGYPTSYTYKGQTVVKIDAYADIPGAADPRLDCDTANW